MGYLNDEVSNKGLIKQNVSKYDQETECRPTHATVKKRKKDTDIHNIIIKLQLRNHQVNISFQ